MSDLAYVILNYNSANETLTLVNQIRSFDSNSLVVVVDNCSSDESPAILKESQNVGYELILSDVNGGYGKGNNLGLKFLLNVNPVYVAICNPDICIESKHIERLKGNLSLSDNVAVAGLQMVDEQNTPHNSAWFLPSLLDDIILSSSILLRLFGNPVLKKKNRLEVEVIQGAFFLANYQKFQQVDFFDERTFLYCEERILGQKLKANDLKVHFDGSLSFIHRVGGSINEIYANKAQKFKLLRDSRLVYHKYYKGYLSYLIYKYMSYLFLVEKLGGDLCISLIKRLKSKGC